MEKISNVSFGMKMPTKQVIELGFVNNVDTRMENGKNLWERKVEAIKNLTGVDIVNRGSMGCAYTFENVAAAIKEQFPQLNPIWEKISILLFKYDDKKYYRNLDKIYKEAETQVGAELDVDEKSIKLATI